MQTIKTSVALLATVSLFFGDSGVLASDSLTAARLQGLLEPVSMTVTGPEISDMVFPAVVRLHLPENGRTGSCTGTFISRVALLTAEHCLRDLTSLPYIVISGKKHSAKQVIFPPIDGISGEAGDIGIVIFDQLVAPAVMPLELDDVAVGEVVTMVGYGLPKPKAVNGWISLGGNRDELRRRKGENIITEVSQTEYVLEGRLGDPSHAEIWHGDSGGPLIHRNHLIGVCNSSNVKQDGGTNRYRRISHPAARAFLETSAIYGSDIPINRTRADLREQALAHLPEEIKKKYFSIFSPWKPGEWIVIGENNLALLLVKYETLFFSKHITVTVLTVNINTWKYGTVPLTFSTTHHFPNSDWKVQWRYHPEVAKTLSFRVSYPTFKDSLFGHLGIWEWKNGDLSVGNLP